MVRVTVAPETLIGNPDVNAMLQAYYSRSHKPIQERLDELGGDNINKVKDSLSKFYVGYGHDSIGQCGKITIFIEDVSMLTARAIQHHALYDGQEASSRYIDFTQQPPADWADKTTHREIIQQYARVCLQLTQAMKKEFPELSDAAIKPKVFDVARGLLPITCTTQLSWTGSIHSIRTHLGRLLRHPHMFVADDAYAIQQALEERWPSLFSIDSIKEDPDYIWYWDGFQPANTCNWSDIYGVGENNRLYGTYSYSAPLDFAGFRDVARHRPAYIQCMDPFHSGGLFSFYKDTLNHYNIQFDDNFGSPLLGVEVNVIVNADLPQWKYMIDLRTSPTVHHSVRSFFRNAHSDIVAIFPNLGNGEYQHFNVSDVETDWERRAKQTIAGA